MESNILKKIYTLSLGGFILIFLVKLFTTFYKYIIQKNIPYLLSENTTATQAVSLCSWDPSRFLVFSGNVSDNLIYFSHFIPLFLAIIVGVVVFTQRKKDGSHKLFFIMTALFSLWVFADLITWANEKPEIIMFAWSGMFLIEALLFLSYICFSYQILLRKKITPLFFLLVALPIIPIVILWGTPSSLQYFDLTNCDREAQEGWLALFLYGYEIFLFIIHIVITNIARQITPDKKERNASLLIAGVLGLLMITMSIGNIIGSITNYWELVQYTLLLMPLLIIVLSFVMTKNQTFGKSYQGIQITIVILLILTGSLFIIHTISQTLFQIFLFVIMIYISFIGWQLYTSTREQNLYQEKIQNINKELLITQKKLQDLDTTKNEFLSFATHQLRSPLTSLKWGLGTVAESTKNDNQTATLVQQLRNIADDMISTVNDLLDISKIEQGGLIMTTESVDLVEFLDRISEEYRAPAQMKQLEFTFTTELATAIISADKTKLRQVFGNIIDNAIKYTPAGSIKVTLSQQDVNYIVAVTDTGSGIDQTELEKLFIKFGRGNAGKASSSGSGLGLYLAKKIVELHHGSISIASPGTNKGSVFTVTLPKINS